MKTENTPNTPSDPSERFRTTRAAHRDETAEDYAEAVEHLIHDTGEARVRDLAKVMGVSHVTVHRIIKRLAREGLVEVQPYKPIRLTTAGRRVARAARERHETVLAFLRAAGVSARQAQLDAEGIEHHVSDTTLRALRRVTKMLAKQAR